jgi:hypothetical protein
VVYIAVVAGIVLVERKHFVVFAVRKELVVVDDRYCMQLIMVIIKIFFS